MFVLSLTDIKGFIWYLHLKLKSNLSNAKVELQSRHINPLNTAASLPRWLGYHMWNQSKLQLANFLGHKALKALKHQLAWPTYVIMLHFSLVRFPGKPNYGTGRHTAALCCQIFPKSPLFDVLSDLDPTHENRAGNPDGQLKPSIIKHIFVYLMSSNCPCQKKHFQMNVGSVESAAYDPLVATWTFASALQWK